MIDMVKNIMRNRVQKFSYDKYWKLRQAVYERRYGKMRRLIAFLEIRKMEAFSNSSIGLYLNGGDLLCYPTYTVSRFEWHNN